MSWKVLLMKTGWERHCLGDACSPKTRFRCSCLAFLPGLPLRLRRLLPQLTLAHLGFRPGRARIASLRRGPWPVFLDLSRSQAFEPRTELDRDRLDPLARHDPLRPQLERANKRLQVGEDGNGSVTERGGLFEHLVQSRAVPAEIGEQLGLRALLRSSS